MSLEAVKLTSRWTGLDPGPAVRRRLAPDRARAADHSTVDLEPVFSDLDQSDQCAAAGLAAIHDVRWSDDRRADGRHRSVGRRHPRAFRLYLRLADQQRLCGARHRSPRCLAGTACGLVNGVIVTIARIPPFIATYGMLWIAFGLGYVFMKGEVIYGLPESFRFIGAGFVWGIPVPVIVAAAAARCAAFPAAQDRARPRRSTRSAAIRTPHACPACRSRGV